MATSKKTLGPRVSAESEKFLSENFENLNQGAQFVLEAFPMLFDYAIKEMKGRFTEGELSLILDVSNGCIPTAQIIGQGLIGQLSDGISLDRLDEKWGVKRDEIIPKIQGLTTFQRAVLELWAYSFWYGKRPQNPGYHMEPGEFERYIKSLLREE